MIFLDVFYDIDKRVILFADYIIENRTTVRKTACFFGISKSTVHKDVALRLRNLDPDRYDKVREILNQNKAERHIRGGLATKQKYANRGEL